MKKKYLYVIIAVLISGIVTFYFVNRAKSSQPRQFSYATVTRGNISMKVTGTGNITNDVRVITLKGNGTVKKVYFKEGDTVKKGDLLYEIENESLKQQIEEAKLNVDLAAQQLKSDLESYNKSIANLKITSPSDGIVDSILVQKGQNVSAGTQVATIADYSHVTVRVPFNSVQIKNIKVGQKADIFLYDSLTTITGTVEYVSHQAVPHNTMEYYYVTVGLDNPGALSDGMKVQVSIHTDNGVEKALEDSTLTVKNTVTVIAKTSGTVEKINVTEGENVKKGTLLVELSSDNISDTQIQNDKLALTQAQNNYNELLEQLENLKIYSPIDGKIVSQNIKEGDVLGSSTSDSTTNGSQSSQLTFVPISDVSELSNYESEAETAVIVGNGNYTVNLSVDEADIKNIKVGQKAEITTDDLPDKTFTGTVTAISQLPTVENGVSSYTVTVELDSNGDLMLGMSVNISIIVAEKENVLLLPLQAVQTNDDKKYVILYTDDLKNQKSKNSTTKTSLENNIKFIETGIYNDNYIEITSGLKEGDKVLIPTTSSSTNTNSQRAGFGIMGGPGAGPVPGANPPGNKPSQSGSRSSGTSSK
ncbi:efflux transporter, RND family, MFP subunit [Thermoanaerobacter mathranii subsp. mathranii str. A3]|uniref:Efflux transporter, RND family, MFP subunit n=1 Tax=Thermoanaerobacter mathranii subsp. mathranii (strain DSM 11426 / CCUG 53645 / CIP 108742 / A3) TaxID=583358 RepID=A0ABM5LN05_THEM3|nr:HlyD family efflux transporter periplasmic adaptor subunit [Thermoanaerobacter mathranii]ADH60080.1 efflux transporter, RND family, MFP subunit [Thermoanaerobacter mathranii subsp. mathranii str. A3]